MCQRFHRNDLSICLIIQLKLCVVYRATVTLVVRAMTRDDRQTQEFSGSLDKISNIVVHGGRHVNTVDLQCTKVQT